MASPPPVGRDAGSPSGHGDAGVSSRQSALQARGFAWLGAYLPLLALGTFSELIYLFYFVRQFPLLSYYHQTLALSLIAGASPRALAIFVGELALLFFLFGLAWWQVQDQGGSAALWLILGFGAAFAITMVFMYPATYLDVYAYIANSWLMVHYHQNPLVVPAVHYPQDPLLAYVRGFPAHFVVEYGPLGVVTDAVPTLLAGRNLLATLILLKAMFSAMTLACAWLVYRILARIDPRRALGGALLVAWNPLIVFQVSGYAHNDAAVVLLMTFALVCLIEGERFVAPMLVAASALVKFSTGLLVPLFLAYFVSHLPPGWRRRSIYLVSVAPAVVVLATLAYAPFGGLSTLQHQVAQVESYYGGSLAAAMNALSPRLFPPDRVRVAGRIVFIPFFLYAIRQSSRSEVDLLRACFITAVLFLALGGPRVEAWYFVWTSVLAAAVPRLAERLTALVLAFTAMLSVAADTLLWPWLQQAQPGAGILQFTNTISYVVTFVPPLVLYVLLLRWLRRDGGAADTWENAGSSRAAGG